MCCVPHVGMGQVRNTCTGNNGVGTCILASVDLRLRAAAIRTRNNGYNP